MNWGDMRLVGRAAFFFHIAQGGEIIEDLRLGRVGDAESPSFFQGRDLLGVRGCPRWRGGMRIAGRESLLEAGIQARSTTALESAGAAAAICSTSESRSGVMVNCGTKGMGRG